MKRIKKEKSTTKTTRIGKKVRRRGSISWKTRLSKLRKTARSCGTSFTKIKRTIGSKSSSLTLSSGKTGSKTEKLPKRKERPKDSSMRKETNSGKKMKS